MSEPTVTSSRPRAEEIARSVRAANSSFGASGAGREIVLIKSLHHKIQTYYYLKVSRRFTQRRGDAEDQRQRGIISVFSASPRLCVNSLIWTLPSSCQSPGSPRPRIEHNPRRPETGPSRFVSVDPGDSKRPGRRTRRRGGFAPPPAVEPTLLTGSPLMGTLGHAIACLMAWHAIACSCKLRFSPSARSASERGAHQPPRWRSTPRISPRGASGLSGGSRGAAADPRPRHPLASQGIFDGLLDGRNCRRTYGGDRDAGACDRISDLGEILGAWCVPGLESGIAITGGNKNVAVEAPLALVAGGTWHSERASCETA
ncbi:MAG: hypothetical protein JWN86_1104 [Planctomycetota bacterium]|nr:hypothetical protein [Planctomycetota bacterium]